MAVIKRKSKDTRVVETGSVGVRETLLAGPASGSGKFTVRRITVKPGGYTARTTPVQTVVYFVHQGKIVLSHQKGELDLLSQGDTAVVHPDEVHHFHNTGKSNSVVIKVASQ